MRSRAGIKVAMTTAGSVTPGYADQGRPYRWRGNEDWVPNHPQYREDAARPEGTPQVTEERARRIAEFAGYRDEGLSVAEAGRMVDISPKTARTYERERKQQQRGESRDG